MSKENNDKSMLRIVHSGKAKSENSFESNLTENVTNVYYNLLNDLLTLIEQNKEDHEPNLPMDESGEEDH